MKTNPIIYFVLILDGALLMGFGPKYFKNNIAWYIGLLLLLFGVYKLVLQQKNKTKKDNN